MFYNKVAEQLNLINQKVEKTPELKKLLPQLEIFYEVRIKIKEGGRMPKLTPEMEAILWKITGKDLRKA